MAYKNKQKNKYSLLVLAFVLILSAICTVVSLPINSVQAQGNEGQKYTLLEPLPCIPGNGVTCSAGPIQKEIDMGNFIQYAFNLLIALAAVSAVFMMVWGGFQYMTSDAWKQKTEGKEKFYNAIYGLLMVLAAFLILRTVNPKLVAIPQSIPAIKMPAGESPLDVMDRLNKEMAQTNINFKEVLSNIASDKATIAGLEMRQRDIDAQILAKTNNQLLTPFEIDGICGQVLGNPEVEDLCTERAQNIKEINRANGDIQLQTIIGEADSAVAGCNRATTNLVEECDKQLLSIGNIQQNEISLRKGLQPDQIRTAGNYVAYSQAVIEITKQQGVIYKALETGTINTLIDSAAKTLGADMTPRAKAQAQKDAAIVEIDKIVKSYATMPNNDPALLLKLQEKQKLAIDDIKSMLFHP